MDSQAPQARTYLRFPVSYPVIFAGAPFTGEGRVVNLSLTGCSVQSPRTVLQGSFITLHLWVPDPSTSLRVELARVRWTQAEAFGVEFIRLPSIARQRLDRTVWEHLTTRLRDGSAGRPGRKQDRLS